MGEHSSFLLVRLLSSILSLLPSSDPHLRVGLNSLDVRVGVQRLDGVGRKLESAGVRVSACALCFCWARWRGGGGGSVTHEKPPMRAYSWTILPPWSRTLFLMLVAGGGQSAEAPCVLFPDAATHASCSSLGASGLNVS